MKNDLIVKLISSEPETFFAPPAFETFIYEKNISEELNIDKIKQLILSKENYIKQKYPSFNDGNTGLGNDSLTSRYPYYNLFHWFEISELKEVVKKTHTMFLNQINLKDQNVYGQCWANVMRKDEQIKKHSHYNDPLTYLGGHICIETNNTSTHYINPFTKKIYSSKNEIGKITLFPNWIEHYTDISKSSLRITIAFDLFTEKFYNNVVSADMKKHWEKL